ncbi:hypothetical protein RND71_036315 [Anisodus tanguticus]|uniref:DUF4283 domain-containing protein n=1 Tax=Anisodus tanguticus TaxID=243964 RepID=A0AAE1R5Y3_9SOLA|nr:hypothetical protein RND71_036315 [Anisodus tanguticus]
MAIPATGRPPPEVGHHPPTPPQPLDYSNLFKSSPTIPNLTNTETVNNGGNLRYGGSSSPMATSIPIKPIVYLHGEPTVRFEKKEVEVMIHHQDLTLAIVGKFSHGWPDIAFLRNAIPKQCGLKAEVRIGLLCDRHVLIRCTIGEDFDTLMSRQTFEIKEKTRPYLMRTFKWDVSFNPAEESRFAYGWISFPGLSPHYYGESTLFSLAAAVGSPIAIDAATLNKTRPSCARVKVEFDLLKSHPPHVVIQVGEGDGITTELQKIRYDFKPKYCTNCKLQGHDVDGCWNLKPKHYGRKKLRTVMVAHNRRRQPAKQHQNPTKNLPKTIENGGIVAETTSAAQNPNPDQNPNPTRNQNPTRIQEETRLDTQNPTHTRNPTIATQNPNQNPNPTRNLNPTRNPADTQFDPPNPTQTRNPTENNTAQQNPNSILNPNPTRNLNHTRNPDTQQDPEKNTQTRTPNPTRNNNNTRNPNPNQAQNPGTDIASQNPYAALELEDTEEVQEGGIKEAALEVATAAPVVTTKQWVANSFEGNNVPINKECAEIPSNTSSERHRWSDEVEDVVEEGEILNSEESTNSSSPDDPGEEEAGKENTLAIVIVPEEVDAQEEKQLEDNSAIEAQPINMEAETTAEASQIQGQKPEENVNAEKVWYWYNVPNLLLVRQYTKMLLLYSFHHMIHGTYRTIDIWRIISFTLCMVEIREFRTRGPHISLPFEGVRVSGAHTVHHWWEFEVFRLGGPHTYGQTSMGSRLRGSAHTVHHWWESKEIRLGGPHIYLIVEGVRGRGTHTAHHRWEFEGFRLEGPHIYWIDMFTEGDPKDSIVGGVHTDILWWTQRLEDHHVDCHGNPRVTDLEDHRHRFTLGYTGSLYSFVFLILLLTQVRHHATREIPRQNWYQLYTFSELLISDNRYRDYMILGEWYQNHLLTHHQCVVLVPRCAQSADDVTISGDGIHICDIQDNLRPAIFVYMSFYIYRETYPTCANRHQTHARHQTKRCSLQEIQSTSAHRHRSQYRVQPGSFYRIGEIRPTSAYRRQTYDRLQLTFSLGCFQFLCFSLCNIILRYGGSSSPMATSIPIKPIVYLHGEPTVRFEKKEVEVMIHHQDLTLAIVGKFSHGWPDIAFLRNAIPKQCGLKAEICVWMDFISGLSPHYYGESTLFSLAAAMGSPIAIDAATLNKTRPSCARVKVEFDLLKSHPPHVVIQVGEGDGITTELQKIRYDFKPKYCTNCKLQGHDVDGCWNLKPALRPEKAKDSDGGKVATAKATEVEIGKGKASLPTPSSSNPSQQNPIPTTNALIHAPSNNWTTVTRKNKKNKNQNPKPPSKVTGTVTPATGTVIPVPRAIGNTVQVSESVFRPKNTPP